MFCGCKEAVRGLGLFFPQEGGVRSQPHPPWEGSPRDHDTWKERGEADRAWRPSFPPAPALFCSQRQKRFRLHRYGLLDLSAYPVTLENATRRPESVGQAAQPRRVTIQWDKAAARRKCSTRKEVKSCGGFHSSVWGYCRRSGRPEAVRKRASAQCPTSYTNCHRLRS